MHFNTSNGRSITWCYSITTNIIFCHQLNTITSHISTLMIAAQRQCRNITANEGPRDGGLICHWFREEHSASCNVICNPGYERAAGIRDMEICGPTTGFRWTFEVADDAHGRHMTHYCVGEWIVTLYILHCYGEISYSSLSTYMRAKTSQITAC